MLQVMVGPAVGEPSCGSKARCRRMQQAKPPPDEGAMLLTIRRIALLAGILEEQPAELAVVLGAAIVVQRSDGQVRQDVLVDGPFDCCGRRPAPFGNDSRASRPHALEPVDGRLLFLFQGFDALGLDLPWLQLLPGSGGLVYFHSPAS